MTAAELAQVTGRLNAATGAEHWHWAGNVDVGEPYLATWVPGAGRCQVLSIGHEERSTTGPEADRVRSAAREFDLGDPEELVQNWATDRFGEPMHDPRLQFLTDLMCVDARERVIYEVAPEATSRQDPNVYRADVGGINHPDARFIEHAGRDMRALLTELEALREDNRQLMQRAERAESRLATLAGTDAGAPGEVLPAATGLGK